MTTFTTEDRQAASTCGCGRSPTGYCVGWHGLVEEDYLKERDQWELNKYMQEAQALWFEGGSCTGGNISYFVNESGLKIDAMTGNLLK